MGPPGRLTGSPALAGSALPRDPAGVTAPEDPRARFRALPDPVLPEDAVETVDVTATRTDTTESDERDTLLRRAGG